MSPYRCTKCSLKAYIPWVLFGLCCHHHSTIQLLYISTTFILFKFSLSYSIIYNTPIIACLTFVFTWNIKPIIDPFEQNLSRVKNPMLFIDKAYCLKRTKAVCCNSLSCQWMCVRNSETHLLLLALNCCYLNALVFIMSKSYSEILFVIFTSLRKKDITLCAGTSYVFSDLISFNLNSWIKEIPNMKRILVRDVCHWERKKYSFVLNLIKNDQWEKLQLINRWIMSPT